MVALTAVSCRADLEDDYDNLSTVEFSSASSRALSISTPTFNKEDYIWYYTANKADSFNTIDYGATGETLTLVGSTGSLDEAVGPFSLGYWDFNLYAFAKDSTSITIANASFSGKAEKVLIEKQKANEDQIVYIEITKKQSESGTGTLIISKDINLVNKDGNAYTYTDSEGNTKNFVVSSATYKKANSEDTATTLATTDFWTVNLSSGAYEVTLIYEATETATVDETEKTETVTYASSTIIVNVYDNLTTEVSGSLDELTQTVIFDVVLGRKFTITYDLNAGTDTVINSNPSYYWRDVNEGTGFNKDITLVYPERENYVFLGWKAKDETDDSKATLTYTISADTTEDIELVAVWAKDIEYLTVDANGNYETSTLTMGTYPSTAPDSYKGQGIEWLVLSVDKDNKRVLLLSKYVLTYGNIRGTSSEYRNWKGSYWYNYLNGYGSSGNFISEYGLSNVKMANVTHYTNTVSSTNKDSWGAVETSNEPVFLLSWGEVEQNSVSTNTGMENGAKYIVGTGTVAAYTIGYANDLQGKEKVDWWLRSPFATYLSAIHIIGSNGHPTIAATASSRGIRPAFWYYYGD